VSLYPWSGFQVEYLGNG